ncbi:MAG: hypothetical protein FWH02_04205 [Oscillospiraceae bacterium]|nr:hypothetical protein [Oscillospiraceae bacterium]
MLSEAYAVQIADQHVIFMMEINFDDTICDKLAKIHNGELNNYTHCCVTDEIALELLKIVLRL